MSTESIFLGTGQKSVIDASVDTLRFVFLRGDIREHYPYNDPQKAKSFFSSLFNNGNAQQEESKASIRLLKSVICLDDDFKEDMELAKEMNDYKKNCYTNFKLKYPSKSISEANCWDLFTINSFTDQIEEPIQDFSPTQAVSSPITTILVVLKIRVGGYVWYTERSWRACKALSLLLQSSQDIQQEQEYIKNVYGRGDILMKYFPLIEDNNIDVNNLIIWKKDIDNFIANIISSVNIIKNNFLLKFFDYDKHHDRLQKSLKIIRNFLNFKSLTFNERLLRFYSEDLMRLQCALEYGIEVYNIDHITEIVHFFSQNKLAKNKEENGEEIIDKKKKFIVTTEPYILWLDKCDDLSVSRLCLTPKSIFDLDTKNYEDEKLSNGIFLSDIADVRLGASSVGFCLHPFNIKVDKKDKKQEPENKELTEEEKDEKSLREIYEKVQVKVSKTNKNKKLKKNNKDDDFFFNDFLNDEDSFSEKSNESEETEEILEEDEDIINQKCKNFDDIYFKFTPSMCLTIVGSERSLNLQLSSSSLESISSSTSSSSSSTQESIPHPISYPSTPQKTKWKGFKENDKNSRPGYSPLKMSVNNASTLTPHMKNVLIGKNKKNIMKFTANFFVDMLNLLVIQSLTNDETIRRYKFFSRSSTSFNSLSDSPEIKTSSFFNYKYINCYKKYKKNLLKNQKNLNKINDLFLNGIEVDEEIFLMNNIIKKKSFLKYNKTTRLFEISSYDKDDKDEGKNNKKESNKSLMLYNAEVLEAINTTRYLHIDDISEVRPGKLSSILDEPGGIIYFIFYYLFYYLF